MMWHLHQILWLWLQVAVMVGRCILSLKLFRPRVKVVAAHPPRSQAMGVKEGERRRLFEVATTVNQCHRWKYNVM